MPEDNDVVMERYAKQISLDTIGINGQKTLCNSSVLVIGAGGLGCPALHYLAGIGIGRIGIMDADIVSLDNLHRQILYAENDIGKSKVTAAKEHLNKLNSSIDVIPHNYFLSMDNAKSIIEKYDLVLDCTDQITARYLINDTCVLLGKTFIYGALHHYEGQISVFNYKNSGTYRCLFPENPYNLNITTCNDGGVMPAIAGIIGVMQANEAIKVLLNLKDILSNTLLVLDSRNYSIRKLNYTRKAISVSKKLKSEQESVQMKSDKVETQTNISIDKNELSFDHILLDIRSSDEVIDFPLPNSIAIDPVEVEDYILNLKTKKNTVLICNNGSRSLYLTKILRTKGIPNVQSLEQGIKHYEYPTTVI